LSRPAKANLCAIICGQGELCRSQNGARTKSPSSLILALQIVAVCFDGVLHQMTDAETLTAVNVAAAGDPVAVGMIRDGGGHRMGQVLAGSHLHPVSNFFPSIAKVPPWLRIEFTKLPLAFVDLPR
jgi:hypothetical protein